MNGYRWTKSEIDRLWALREAGVSYDKIGAELNRTPKSCLSRLKYEAHKRAAAPTRHEHAALEALAASSRTYQIAIAARQPATQPAKPAPAPAAEARGGGRSALDHQLWPGVDVRDIAARGVTAVVLGDPPPGRSALDQRAAIKSSITGL